MSDFHFYVYHVNDRDDKSWCEDFARQIEKSGAAMSIHTPFDRPLEFLVNEDSIHLFILTPTSWASELFRNLVKEVIAIHPLSLSRREIVGIFHKLVGVGNPLSNYRLINVVNQNAEDAAQKVIKDLQQELKADFRTATQH